MGDGDGLGRHLQALVAAAWPATESVVLGEWCLRSSSGLTCRANSVLATGDPGSPLSEAIPEVESFYAARHLPSRFQVGASTAPAELVSDLARRGYREEAPTLVQAAAVDAVAARPPDGRWRIEVDSLPSPDWWVAHGGIDVNGTAGSEEVARGLYRHMLLGPAVPTAFVTAFEDGRPAACGQGLVQGDWLGIQSMRSRPEHRRRGGASAVLAAIAAWGAGGGCRRAYLAVMAANDGARALYAQAGFVTVDGYVYLVRPAESAAGQR